MRWILLVLLGLTACANLPPRPGSNEEGERFGQAYLKALRWQGPRASVELLAPELRQELLERIKSQKLEEHLKVTEYESHELTRTAQDTLLLSADIDWYREPDVTVHHELATIHLGYRQGGWFVEGVEGGPMPISPLPPPTAQVDGGAP